jgi:heme/copper-type cytochrome/quinol oxidase subunit 4
LAQLLPDHLRIEVSMSEVLLMPHVAGPLIAMTVVVLTAVAHWLAVAEPRRWTWRVLVAWAIPAATSGIMLTVFLWKGDEYTGNLASILSLVVSVVVATLGNGAQWLLIARARAGRADAPAGPAA